MPSRTLERYAETIASGVGSAGVATNASWVGPWVNIEGVTSIGVQVNLTGTTAPVGTWGADVIDTEKAPTTANPGELTETALTLTAAQLAQNPIGDSANINFLFQFDPAPRAKWFRFKLTRSAGGSASQLLKSGISMYGGAP